MPYTSKRVNATNQVNGGTGYVLDSIPITSAEIGSTVRKNSDIEIQGEIQEEKADTKTEFMIGRVKKGAFESETVRTRWTDENGYMDNVVIAYRHLYASPYSGTIDPIEFARMLYDKYFAFRKHSNIRVEVETAFPFHVLMSLNFNLANVFSGQPFMLDQLRFQLPDNGKQTAVLRTTKLYEDRPQVTNIIRRPQVLP